MSLFGNRLKNLRNYTMETQDDLGKALGKSREAVSKYEKGDREPDLNVLTSLAKHFNVSADYMLGLTDAHDIVKEPHKDIYSFDNNESKRHLDDKSFEQYLRLAVKIKDFDLPLDEVERFVDDMIKKKNIQNKNTL